MLEGLHFVLGGCVGKSTQDSDRIAALNYNGESLTYYCSTNPYVVLSL